MKKLMVYVISASANVRNYLTTRLSAFVKAVVCYRTLAEARWKMRTTIADDKKALGVALVDSDMEINGKAGKDYLKDQFPTVGIYEINDKVRAAAEKAKVNENDLRLASGAVRPKTTQDEALAKLRVAAIEARQKNRDESFKERNAKAVQTRKDAVMAHYRQMTDLAKQTTDLKSKRIIMMNSLAMQILKIGPESTVIRTGMLNEYKHHFGKLYGKAMSFSDAKDIILLTRSQIKAQKETEAKQRQAGGSGQAA